MDSKYISIIEYARENNVSDMTVRRRIKTGKLYAVLRDGKYFIPEDGSKGVSRAAPMSHSFEMPKKDPVPPKPRVPVREDFLLEKKPREEEQSPAQEERLLQIDRLLSSSISSRSSLESKKLIELCEKVLAKIEKSEFFVEEKFFARFDNIESEMNILRSRFEASNMRVGRLEKKIEELNMLVDIIESEGVVLS
jgi:hypothetical protein